eukprot:9851945-Alexandrium_andersonii.AAC.1
MKSRLDPRGHRSPGTSSSCGGLWSSTCPYRSGRCGRAGPGAARRAPRPSASTTGARCDRGTSRGPLG